MDSFSEANIKFTREVNAIEFGNRKNSTGPVRAASGVTNSNAAFTSVSSQYGIGLGTVYTLAFPNKGRRTYNTEIRSSQNGRRSFTDVVGAGNIGTDYGYSGTELITTFCL